MGLLNKKTEGFWDILGEILAVVLVVDYALLIINASFSFIPNGTFKDILEIIRTYGSIALIGVVGFESVCKRSTVFKIIFLVLLAIVVVFLFFPGTYDNLINLVK